MPLKEDILKKYAAKYNVPFELAFQVFEEERANIRSSKPEIEFRRERIENLIGQWVDSKKRG